MMFGDGQSGSKPTEFALMLFRIDTSMISRPSGLGIGFPNCGMSVCRMAF